MSINSQLTVGELRDQLESVPDDTPVEIFVSDAVGFVKSARKSGNVFVVSEHR